MSILRKIFTNKVLLSIGSALGVAALMYVALPLELAAVMYFILVSHELAHVIAALVVGAKPSWPIFIPLGIIVLGLTKIKDIDLAYVKLVALAGPMLGAWLSLMVLIIGAALGNTILLVAGGLSFLFEVLTGTIGHDGRIAKRYAQYA